jgi:hypothetical protein
VGDELASVLKKDEGMFGTGPEGALKAIQVSCSLLAKKQADEKWEMLHHSVNSPLATVAQRYVPPMLGEQYEADRGSDNTRLAEIEAILASFDDDTPGRELFQLSAGPDLSNVIHLLISRLINR